MNRNRTANWLLAYVAMTHGGLVSMT